MIQYLVPLFLALACWGFLKFYLNPKRQRRNYVKLLRQRGFKVLERPFTPFSIPLFANLRQDAKQGDALRTMKEIYPKYDVVVSNLFNKPMLEFIHPDFMAAFYSKDIHLLYPKALSMMFPLIRVTFGGGLAFTEGEVWARKRKILNRLVSFDLIKNMSERMAQICEQSILKFEKDHRNPDENYVVYEIDKLMMIVAADVIGECFLGGAASENIEGEPLCKFLMKNGDIAIKQSRKLLAFLFKEKYLNLNITEQNKQVNRRIALLKKWQKQVLRKKIQQASEHIKNQKEARTPRNLLQALAMDQLSKEHSLKQQEFLEEMSVFLGAGVDTTMHFTAFMVYEIAKNPSIEKKLREEVEALMGGNDYSYENLKKMAYIDCLLKEVVRVYGPTNMLLIRQAKQDNYLNGIPIVKGTNITLNSIGNHFNQKFFKEPHSFRPERWEDQCKELPAYAQGGFGGGARTCIGKSFGLLQIKVFLIKLLKRYNKILLPEQPPSFMYTINYRMCQFKPKMIIAS